MGCVTICQVTLFTDVKKQCSKTNFKNRIHLDSPYTRCARPPLSLRWTIHTAWRLNVDWCAVKWEGFLACLNPTSLPWWSWHASLRSASYFPAFSPVKISDYFGDRSADPAVLGFISERSVRISSVSTHRGWKRAWQFDLNNFINANIKATCLFITTFIYFKTSYFLQEIKSSNTMD